MIDATPPEKNNFEETLGVIIKGASSPIPGLNDILSLFSPIKERNERWMHSVAGAIKELQNKSNIEIEELANNEAFCSILLQATEIAIKNHQAEKIQYLSNALVSFGEAVSPDVDRSFKYMSLIDEMTVSHVKILQVLDKHLDQLKRYKSLESIYEEIIRLEGEIFSRSDFRIFLGDLQSKRLVVLGSVDDYPEYQSGNDMMLLESSIEKPLTVTKFGRDFLEFIKLYA